MHKITLGASLPQDREYLMLLNYLFETLKNAKYFNNSLKRKQNHLY